MSGRWRYGVVACAAFFLSKLPMDRHETLADPGPHEPVKVGGLQYEGVTLTEFIAGTRDLPDGLDFVVWPEYALPYDVQKNPHDWKLIEDLCCEKGITLVFGTKYELSLGGWRNIALTTDANGVRGRHTKVHTVHFFDDGEPGTASGVIETAHGKVGTPICFDCDFEGVVRRMTAAGAEFIVTPIMDARSWSARQHDQHAELFQIRACENRRWMFVLGTSGVSQVIDPKGRVVNRLGAMEQGAITGKLRRETGLTFYTSYGWLTPWLVLISGACCWLALMVARPKRLWSHPPI
jgi:apolipoprotein N-acyltransferase